MQNFDTDLDVQGVAQVVTSVPVVQSSVQTSIGRPVARTDLLQVEEVVGWEALRDYVVSKIEHHHGPFPRNPITEKAIFSSFLGRWGDKAMAIAKAAFEVHGGWWSSAPISVNRFCRASDPYFAKVIAERLEVPQSSGWQ